jgi:integral membrane sensor domain MASE1
MILITLTYHVRIVLHGAIFDPFLASVPGSCTLIVCIYMFADHAAKMPPLLDFRSGRLGGSLHARTCLTF